MNWFKENKFLTGLLVAFVVLAAALVFLMLSARSGFSAAETEYNSKSADLKRLQGLTPYPEEANAKKLREQAKEIGVRNAALQEQLVSMEYPLEPITPEKFQDVLNEKVRAVVQKAADSRVSLPQKFYLGFDQYETIPPSAAAAPGLALELKGIAFVVNKLIEAKVTALESVSRPALPEELGKAPATPPPATAKRLPAGARAPAAPAELVKVTSFEITFLAEQENFRRVLNEIAAAKTPFLITRVAKIDNENPKGPPRTTSSDGIATDGTAAKPAPAISVLVGAEKVRATLRIDIADFAEPVEKSKAK